ncbi:hypothetical protein, partial [Escherichia coli]|uniref:hypothetical protein n=1 Tax=Escherichia coli TaxID=562 RepID=UPI003CE57931
LPLEYKHCRLLVFQYKNNSLPATFKNSKKQTSYNPRSYSVSASADRGLAPFGCARLPNRMEPSMRLPLDLNNVQLIASDGITA